jgi:hypothetical protein
MSVYFGTARLTRERVHVVTTAPSRATLARSIPSATSERILVLVVPAKVYPSSVLLDELDDLVYVAVGKIILFQEPLRGRVRIFCAAISNSRELNGTMRTAGVVRQLERGHSFLDVHVEHIVVLLAIVQLLSRVADGINDFSDLLP